MMRYIRYGFLLFLGLGLLVVALANRGAVTLSLLPGDLARLSGIQAEVTVPVFAVIFGGIAAGLVIGFVWEWLREHRYRSEASRKARDVARLEREMGRLRKPEQKDDVLALLEDARKAS
jgi:uncharacterized integral membrane protein